MEENIIAIIKDGVVVNTIVASDEYAESISEETLNITGLGVGIGWKYENNIFTNPEGLTIEEVKAANKIISEKGWRDHELYSTDFIVPLTDYPNHNAYMAYRQELRDYPSQPDFPNGTRPQKP